MAEITSGKKPYTDNGNIRTFDISVDDTELVWHRDKETRTIEVLNGNGWQCQIDGCFPFLMYPGIKFTIDKGVYHRIIKGIDNLEVRIVKHD